MSLASYLERSADLLREAASSSESASMERAISLCVSALESDAPILVCGNGGSASDALHITGELVGRFFKERRAINAICLSANVAVISAWANDYSFDQIFSRQVEAHGKRGGVLVCLSTSGNSANVVNAAIFAKEIGMTVVSFTGRSGGRLGSFSDVLFAAPSDVTPLIQQVHICLYHYLCDRVEAALLR